VKQLEIIERIADLFARRGAEAYLGEPVTVAEHMLQTAALAQAEAAPDALIAAALLHDIGHLTGELGEYSPQDTVDRRHDTAGAKFLEGLFPPAVTECVRLHVAAKRYLCATDKTYCGKLSEASQHSLSLQGGPMTEAEIVRFSGLEFHREAVRLRLWDDSGKAPAAPTMTFDDYRPLLQRLAAP
jgi:phosphonate degradation associated HDIG domain protein